MVTIRFHRTVSYFGLLQKKEEYESKDYISE